MKKFFVIIALLATLIPAVFVVREVGGLENWQGVPPKGVTDSLYYYARIHEVVDGYPLIGNPYVYEYREAYSPAFFLPDIVSAVPFLLGIPFNFAIMLNMFIWSFVFLILSFTLLQLLRMPRNWALLWSVFLFIGSYSFMLRPTIMQIIYPLFLIFLITLLKFLYEPHERRRIIWLSLAAASTFYAYTFLSYIVFLTFTFIFFWFLFSRRFKEFRAIITVGIFTTLMLIPFGIYTLMQMRSPYYFETLDRIGLAYTHIPSIEAFFYSRWVVIGLIIFGLFWKFFPKNEEGKMERKIFWLATGAGLFVSLFLNVITGVELTIAVHIGRFVLVWMTLIFGVGLYEWYFSKTRKNNYTKYIIVGIFLLMLSVGVFRNILRELSFFGFNNRGLNITELQTYAAPLKWLEENVSEESVIWTNNSISAYIPIMTRHYPLFFHGAVLHSISTEEIEDRYLLSHSLNILTTEDLKNDFGLYSGRAQAKEQPRIENQRAWVCKSTRWLTHAHECPPYTDPITLRGEKYFETLAQRFEIIKTNQTVLLQQFNVKYLIIDRVYDNLGHISVKDALYDDGRFVILSLPLSL